MQPQFSYPGARHRRHRPKTNLVPLKQRERFDESTDILREPAR